MVVELCHGFDRDEGQCSDIEVGSVGLCEGCGGVVDLLNSSVQGSLGFLDLGVHVGDHGGEFECCRGGSSCLCGVGVGAARSEGSDYTGALCDELVQCGGDVPCCFGGRGLGGGGLCRGDWAEAVRLPLVGDLAGFVREECTLVFFRAGAGAFEGVDASPSGHGRVVERVLRADGEAVRWGVLGEVAGEDEEAAVGW